MSAEWNKEHQALWGIFKATIRAFKVSEWLTLEQEEEFINLMQNHIEQKDKECTP